MTELEFVKEYVDLVGVLRMAIHQSGSCKKRVEHSFGPETSLFKYLLGLAFLSPVSNQIEIGEDRSAFSKSSRDLNI